MLARCMLLSFVSHGFTKSWVGQVASRSPINRHALDFTVSLDDQGHEFLYWVPGALHLICAFLDEILALRVPRYRLGRSTAFLAPLSPAELLGTIAKFRQGTDLLSHGNVLSPHPFLMTGGSSLKRYSEVVAPQQILTRLFLRCCLCLNVAPTGFLFVS